MKAILLLSVLMWTSISVVLVLGQEQNRIITVFPEETDEILANPGMGWETFHHTSKTDKNLPSWIPSTVHYARWGWRELEPEPGKIAYDFLDRMLKESHDSGQKLAFRVMCCSPYQGLPYHPDWLPEIGGRILMADYRGQGPFPIPDMDDPIILNAHLDLIKRLGERYDGHPDLDHLDLGSIGWWGEWHLSGSKNCELPTLENRMRVVDAYLAAFTKTPLVMLINGAECTAHAIRHGTGWRADSMGDLGSFSPTWNHMYNAYPALIREGKAQDAWRQGPIAYEPPAAQGANASRSGPTGREAGLGDEVAEHRIGALLSAVPSRRPPDKPGRATACLRQRPDRQQVAARIHRAFHRGFFPGAEGLAARRDCGCAGCYSAAR